MRRHAERALFNAQTQAKRALLSPSWKLNMILPNKKLCPLKHDLSFLNANYASYYFSIFKLTVEWQFLQTPIYEHTLILFLILKIYPTPIIMGII